LNSEITALVEEQEKQKRTLQQENETERKLLSLEQEIKNLKAEKEILVLQHNDETTERKKEVQNLNNQIIALVDELKLQEKQKNTVVPEPQVVPQVKAVTELDADTPYRLMFSNGLYLTLHDGSVSLKEPSSNADQLWQLDENGRIVSLAEKDLVLEIRNGTVQCHHKDHKNDEDDIVSTEFSINFADSDLTTKYIQLQKNTKMMLGSSLKDRYKLVLHVFNDKTAETNKWTFISE
jgi:hypothetical protein